MTRREFMKGATNAAAWGGLTGCTGYSYWESGDLRPHSLTVACRDLPLGFEGARVALLTDLHRGDYISQEYVQRAVEMTLSLKPDVILLGGDYVDHDPRLIVPVMDALGKLEAPLGVYAVQGNRDISASRMLTSRELARQGLVEITNRGVSLQLNGSKLYLAGFDDLTIGHPNIPAGLRGAPRDAAILSLTHSPALVDRLSDPRIKFICCGHTHGGQINLPVIGRPFIPAGCERYPAGLIQSPNAKVFVSVGIGVAYAPIRFCCPPEVSLLTLAGE